MLLLALGSILLSIPTVQTKLGKKVTNYLQDAFDVDITIEKVDLAFLGQVQLKNVFIKDHHGDSLIFAKNLSTSVLSYKKMMDSKLNFGAITLEDFILNIKTYKGEVDDGLTVFIDKFDDGTVSDEPSGFLMTSSELKLKNGNVFIIDDNDATSTPIFFKQITGEAEDLKIQGPNVNVAIKKMSFLENHAIFVKNITSDFTYTKSFMKFENTKLTTATSSIKAVIEFNYKREDFSDFNNKVKLKATVSEAHLSLIDIRNFYDEIGTEDVLHFTTNLEGVLNNFTAKKLDLTSNQNAVVKGDLNFINSFNTENGFELKGKFTELTSDYNHLKKLLPNVLKTLPLTVKTLGRFTIVGDTHITEETINAQTTLTTNLGTLISDLELSNISEIDKALYKGHIKIVDCKLDKISKDPKFGNVSLEVDINGKGFTLEEINASIKGAVSSYDYNGYTYNNIKLNGVVKNKQFNGGMEVNDDNIKLNFVGLANLATDVYTFNFKTDVDYCDLKTIKVFQHDSIAIVKGKIDIDVKGNTLDDLVGTIKFKNSVYSNVKGNYFFKDFNIASSFTDSVRTITINSPEIIEGRVRGKFKVGELGNLIQNSIGSIYTNYNPNEVTANQELDFSFKIYNKIVEVFYPDINLGRNTIIRGTINSNNNLFKLNMKSPVIEAYKNSIKNLSLQIDNKNPLFNTQLSVDKIDSEYYNISKFQLVNVTLNDTLYFRTEFKNGIKKKEKYNLSFFHTLDSNNKSVVGLQNSNFTFKNNLWKINPKNNKLNKVLFDNKTNTYDISPFLITSKNQKIEFSGVVTDTISKDINLKFTNVKLENITPKIDSLRLEGLINGKLNYNQKHSKIKPTANLSINNLTINNSKQGNLNINVEGNNSVTKYTVNSTLVRDDFITFSGKGELDFTPKKPTLDVIVDFEEFKLDAFSPLGEDVFTNIRGFAYGNVNITGVMENPDMTGNLFLDKVGLSFPYINVDYAMEGTSIITLDKQTFTFDDVTLKDTKHNTKGDLTGTLKHSFFKTWYLNLELNTNNLLVLDTKEKENSVYFGTGYLKGVATLSGPTDKLVINVTGKTNKGTHFVIPISNVKTVDDNQLIRFVNKNTDNIEEIRKAFISEKLKGMSLNFNLEVTPDAVIEMVLDKATGSYLKGSGEGNLQIALDTKDKFDMYGDFIVNNGIYNFKYGGFINKPFTVRKGGSISWSGDPYTAILDIEAIYRVSANPRTLLENVNTNRKIPIDLITRFSGELFNSQRAFDIEIPNSSSTVASELKFKLDDNDGNSKTLNFVSLLASGSFYNENDLSVNTNGLVYGTATDMLSNAFDNIFNKGDNKFKLKPVYTVGEKNTIDNLDSYDQISIDVDYQLNDKILINGKVGVPIGSKEQTSVIGEVNIEFLMNEEGSLRSSVFNRQNEIQYSGEEEGYTQGLGISYQIDFDNGRELLEKLGLKKKKVVDSTLQKKADTIIKKHTLIKFKN